MAKKILKRSLALGALMAFVITGSAMAAELKAGEFGTAEDFKTANRLAALSGGSSYCNFYIPYEPDSANELVTTGNIIYKSTDYGGNFGLFAGLSSNKATDQHLANPNGNILDIKHDLKVYTSGTVYLFGGVIDTGADAKYGSAAKGNSVYIGDGKTKITVTAGNHIFIGGAMSNDDAKANVIGNKVVVNNVKFELPENIFAIISGAEARSGSAEENTVEILNTTIENASILGGFVWNEPGSAISNNVKLNNVILGGSSECAGGYVQGVKGNANDNTVNIEGNSQIAGIVYGGYADDGTANNNTVIIKDREISNRVYGGYGAAEASGNTVDITGGTFSDSARLYGGSAHGDAKLNTVNIVGVTLKNNIIAGVSQNGGSLKGDASENKVTIEDSIIYGSVYAGDVAEDHNDDGAANNNEILIKNSQLFDSGKYKENSHVYAGCNNGDGDANGNKLTIIGSQFQAGMYMSAGFSGFGNANENKLIIDGAETSIEGVAFGGRAQIDGNANLNKVTVLDGSIKGRIYGGAANETYNEWYEEDSVEANNNEVVIEGGSIDGAVYGGYAGEKPGDGYVAVANENIVTISGGTVSGNVYGGYSKVGTADNNTVNISGTADVTNASLFGSNKVDGTGNTLNIKGGWTGEAKSFNNFNEINIEEAQWGTAVAEVESLALNDTKVNVGTVHVAGDDTTFVANGSSVLIKSGETTGDVSSDSSVSVFKGVATIYDASVVKDGNDIKIQLGEDAASNPVYNPQVIVIGESRAAATAFTNQGSELIETGLDALARGNKADTKVFASVCGNTSEFATGSEVKVNGWSGVVGVGKTNANGLTVGAFFENGEGNYRTYNDVNGEFMRGDGEACYNGGGFLIRKDNANGVYTEASLRAGNLQNELRNAVCGSEGLTGYDIDTFYYGAHVGIGKVIDRGTDGDSIDVYGKFIYTHHDSETFTIDGDEFHFDSVDSERLRLGFRINEVQNNKLSMYYGAAWEYEFGGDSNNTVVGYDLSTPSLGGSTVIGEVGMHYKASEKWSFDLNGRAYTGQRDGFSGSVQANYMF